MGHKLDEPVYHLLLEGRKIGPYTRRTIAGMRQKKALTSAQLLIAGDGTQLTVADLIRPRHDSDSSAQRKSQSSVQATYKGRLVQVQGQGLEIPSFKGEIEARVQSGVLRISGRFRSGLAWKDDRVKLALKDVVYTRARGRLADLWLEGTGGEEMQCITLDMLTAEGAQNVLQWLPDAAPWPMEGGGSGDPRRKMLLASAIAGAALIAAVALWALTRR